MTALKDADKTIRATADYVLFHEVFERFSGSSLNELLVLQGEEIMAQANHLYITSPDPGRVRSDLVAHQDKSDAQIEPIVNRMITEFDRTEGLTGYNRML